MNDFGQIRAYYRAILPHYDLALSERGDLPFWESIGRRWRSKRILELGCGTGRVTEVLARQASVTGVDLLVEMLERAARRAPGAAFLAADLRQFAFLAPFDLIVLADDPMAHVTSTAERITIMQRIAHHVQRGGRVVLEGLYRSPAAALASARNIDGAQKTLTVEEEWKPAGAESVWETTYRYKEEGSAAIEVTSMMRSWTGDEIDRLAGSGLEIESVCGDFDERPFSDNSPRIVVTARKK